MSKKPNVHVVHKNESWTVEQEGTSGSGEQYGTREEAIEAGKQMAKQNEVELLVHRTDGTIGERESYGNDPRDIPG